VASGGVQREAVHVTEQAGFGSWSVRGLPRSGFGSDSKDDMRLRFGQALVHPRWRRRVEPGTANYPRDHFMGWLKRLFSAPRKTEGSEASTPSPDTRTPVQPKPEDAPSVQGIDIGGMWEQMLNDPEILRKQFGVSSRAELDQRLSDADRAMKGQAIRSAVLDRDTCPTCSELDGKVVGLESTEFEQFMPPNGCTAAECRCEYIVSSLDRLAGSEDDESDASCHASEFVRQPHNYVPPKLDHSDATDCPYCSVEMRPAPRRKKRCRACGSPVFVRTRQELFPAPYLTQTQAVAVDRFATIAEWGASANELQTIVASTAAPGNDSAYLEGIYTLADNLLASMTDRRFRSAILREIAIFRKVDGGDWLSPLRESEREWLLWLQQEGIERVTVDAEDCCEVCGENHRRQFTIAGALQAMVLPNPNCTGDPVCTCHYSDL